jgi:hypothetical protein
MPESHRYRHRHINVALDDEEYRALRRICDALKVPVRTILMIGVRRARANLAEEQRRHLK